MYHLLFFDIKHGIEKGGILVFKYPSRDRVKVS